MSTNWLEAAGTGFLKMLQYLAATYKAPAECGICTGLNRPCWAGSISESPGNFT